jgi:predicted Zn-dependent protease
MMMKLMKQVLGITAFDVIALAMLVVLSFQLVASFSISHASITANTYANNYLKEALNGGKVTHWNVTKMPLRVYISNGTKAGNWSSATKQLVYKAMRTWSTATANKIKFVETPSREGADIVVVWERQLEHSRLGVSPFRAMGNSILYSDVHVATHHPTTGEPLNNTMLLQTITHELGHALGIQGHSPNPKDLMYWSTSPQQTGMLTQTDVNTINALYQLKPDITNGLYGETSAGETRWGAVYTLQLQKLLEQKHYQQAYVLGLEGLKKAPTNPFLLFATGIGAFQIGNQPEAAKYFQKCLQYNPNYTEARYNLALILLKTAEARRKATGADVTTLALYKTAIDHLEIAVKSKNAPTQTPELLRQAKTIYTGLKTMVATS